MNPLLEPIKNLLRRFRTRPETDFSKIDADALDMLEAVRLEAVRAGNQLLAKETWCLKKAIDVQQKYVRAFQEMKDGRYYDGWCTLERAEIDLLNLERHLCLTDEFALAFIDCQIERFQKLFPYGIFMSPALIEREVHCSICDARVSLRSRCEHTVGEIYDGQMALRVITDAEPVEISFVDTPVQRYSVPFSVDPKTNEKIDHYDYSVVEYVVRGLRSPFDEWSTRNTSKRHPHGLYKHIGRNAPCPCESGRKYKSCCLRQEGVLRPHIEVDFSVPPPEDLPTVAYTRTR